MPRFRNAIIRRAKIRDYLLSPKNIDGKSKYFKSLGYTTRNADKFINDLKNGLKDNKAVVYKENKRGDIMMTVTMTIGIHKIEEVQTVWCIEKGQKNPHLVTAYPRRKR